MPCSPAISLGERSPNTTSSVSYTHLRFSHRAGNDPYSGHNRGSCRGTPSHAPAGYGGKFSPLSGISLKYFRIFRIVVLIYPPRLFFLFSGYLIHPIDIYRQPAVHLHADWCVNRWGRVRASFLGYETIEKKVNIPAYRKEVYGGTLMMKPDVYKRQALCRNK